jgi:glycosyltransferase involved in cell wall biosynthesis
MPLISICIPAYKNINYLKSLLDSIALQNFKDFEVVITDDSPDNAIRDLMPHFADIFKIIYLKNDTALGSPANWNYGIANATGEWIKIMHDDDWFTDANSLSEFANACKGLKEVDFIFSGYFEQDIQTGEQKKCIIGPFEKWLLGKSPYNLLKKNFIGHPSTTLIRNNQKEWFKKDLKWVVDIEFYIRILIKKKVFLAIEQPLITIGINPLQITKQVFRNPAIEIPENLSLLHLNPGILKNYYAYDYYWRLLRNLSIRRLSELEVEEQDKPAVSEGLKQMLAFQTKLPLPVIKIGVFSKFFMMVSYVFNLNKN